METLENIFNINHLNTSGITLTKALLFFYIIIASNFTKNLYSGQMREFFDNSRYAQHLIGFVTMLVIIINVGGVTEILPALIYSLIGYVWFIFTTKLDLKWNLIIFGLIVVGYLYESKMLGKEIESENDQALFDIDKNKIKKKNNKMKKLIAGSIIAVTFIGTLFYFNKKQGQYFRCGKQNRRALISHDPYCAKSFPQS